MTIREALQKNKTIEIEILLAHILSKPKEFLFTNPDYKLTTTQVSKLNTLIKRRNKGEPVAYILGYKYFYDLKFKITKDTLIPRPETEWLIDKSLEILATHNSKLATILDMGTGSGCIAITIATNTKATIHAADVSSKALAVAKQNARVHKVKIKFFKSNLFSNISHKYDLIIANLPYVPVGDYKKLKANLKYEPKAALTDGTITGDKLINTFLEQAKGHLTKNGKILLEIDPSQVKNLNKYKGKVYKDLRNLPRYVII